MAIITHHSRVTRCNIHRVYCLIRFLKSWTIPFFPKWRSVGPEPGRAYISWLNEPARPKTVLPVSVLPVLVLVPFSPSLERNFGTALGLVQAFPFGIQKEMQGFTSSLFCTHHAVVLTRLFCANHAVFLTRMVKVWRNRSRIWEARAGFYCMPISATETIEGNQRANNRLYHRICITLL